VLWFYCPDKNICSDWLYDKSSYLSSGGKIIIIIIIIQNLYSAIMTLGGYRGTGGTGR